MITKNLKTKIIDFESGTIPIVVLNEDYAKENGIYSFDRVLINFQGKKSIGLVHLSEEYIKENEVGLYAEFVELIGVRKGCLVELIPTSKPKSIDFIRKKLFGQKLSYVEIDEIIKDTVNHSLSDVELAFFVSAIQTGNMTLNETRDLTLSMVKNGQVLDFGKELILDKHCIGGVPNNRTTMLAVPILSAMGYKIPKLSSRAISSPSGTADTMEAISNVNVDVVKIKKQIKEIGGCIAWGGAFNIAGADDYLIKVRKSLRLDPEALLISSILAKKKAAGSNVLLIDIPFGKGSKIGTKKQAMQLKRHFLQIGKAIGIKTGVVLTNGTQTVGSGVGPILEAIDVVRILKRENGPRDLEDKSLFLVKELLGLAGVKKSINELRTFLDSGKPWEWFKKIIISQNGDLDKLNDLTPSKIMHVVKAKKAGRVDFIDNKRIVKIARYAGSPKDNGAGLFLHKKVGSVVSKGEPLFTIYSEQNHKLVRAVLEEKNFPAFNII